MPIYGLWTGATVSTGIALVALLAAAMFRWRMLIPNEVPDVRVTLILPLTGYVPNIEILFDALFRQTLRPVRLIITVESYDDPAYDRVTRLREGYPQLNFDVVVAGLSDERAQKCTNLLAAFAVLTDDDRYIVCLDGDIDPQPWWLAALVAPLARGQADIVNGYRWQLPRAVSLAMVIGAAIDRAIATLPRPGCFRLLWGGSLAMTRQALGSLNPEAVLSRAMTEDLLFADRAYEIGLRVMTRRGLRVPTPLELQLLPLWQFVRRQYQLIRMYRSGPWLFAFSVCTADLLARLYLIATMIIADGSGRWIAIHTLLALGILGSLATDIRRRIGLRLGIADQPGFALATHAAVWSTISIAAFHTSAVWASFLYSPVVWATVRYEVDSKGCVVRARRSRHV